MITAILNIHAVILNEVKNLFNRSFAGAQDDNEGHSLSQCITAILNIHTVILNIHAVILNIHTVILNEVKNL